MSSKTCAKQHLRAKILLHEELVKPKGFYGASTADQWPPWSAGKRSSLAAERSSCGRWQPWSDRLLVAKMNSRQSSANSHHSNLELAPALGGSLRLPRGAQQCALLSHCPALSLLGELLSTSRRMGTPRGRLPSSEQLPRAALKLCITGSFCLLTPHCKCACLWKFSGSECAWNNYQIEEMQHIQVNLCSQLKRCEIWNNSTRANRITSDWYEGEQHRS